MMRISDLLLLILRRLVCIQFFYVYKAVDDGRMSGSHDGFGGDVLLGVIGEAVEIETMVACNVTRGKHVKDKEKGATHRALGHWECVRRRFINGDELVAVSEG